MTHILIIMSWLAGHVVGHQVTNIEFGNERACLEAAEQVKDKGNSSFSPTRIVALCVRKGDRI